MTHVHVSEVISPEIATVHERRLTAYELQFLTGDLREEIALTPEEKIDRFHTYVDKLSPEEREKLFQEIDIFKKAKNSESRAYLGAMAAEAVVDHSLAKSDKDEDYVAGSLLKKILAETDGLSDEDKQKMLDSVATLLDGKMAERVAARALRIAAEAQAKLEATERNYQIVKEYAENLRKQIENSVGPALHSFVETYQQNPDVLDDITPALEAVEGIDAALPKLVMPRPTTSELERIVGLGVDTSVEPEVSTPPYMRLGIKAAEILNGLLKKDNQNKIAP